MLDMLIEMIGIAPEGMEQIQYMTLCILVVLFIKELLHIVNIFIEALFSYLT